MILQKILYPSSATFEEDLYFRRNRAHVILNSEEKFLETTNCYDSINFDTYFNTFSYKKWKKYTNIENVKLLLDIQGKARVVLTTLKHHNFDIDEDIVYSEVVESDARKTFTFGYPSDPEAELFTFRVQPLCDKLFIFDGAYATDVDEATLPKVNLSLAICSYRREPFVNANMNMLEKEVFSNAESMLNGHLRVYICDNGNTLDGSNYNAQYVRVVPNKNSGGSGGFSRGAIMAINEKEYECSHVILMDDDIIFDVDTLERNYTFLRLLKKEYKINMLGGAMFRTDRRYIQHAAGETHTPDGIIFNKAGYNMYNLIDVIRNEVEECINYLGWWYCCIPVELFAECKYSLPLFVQYDDIEFSLRNADVPKITLNGICCWHIPFDKKWSGFKNYYTIRNRTLVNCMYFPSFTKRKFRKELIKECARKTLQYSYNEANLTLLAAEDFLKGMKWLTEQDPSELNKKVMSMSDKLQDVAKLEMKFDPRKLIKRHELTGGKLKKAWRILTLEGWLLPANRENIIEVDNPPIQHLYRTKRVLKYDIFTDKGIVIAKSYREAFRIFKRLVKDCFLINKRFNKVCKEYRNAKESVISEEFWKEFLEF